MSYGYATDRYEEKVSNAQQGNNAVQGLEQQRYQKFDALPTEPSIPGLLTAVYNMSGLLIRDRSITAKKLREIAASELSRMFAQGLRGKIGSSMKALPGSLNMDVVTYEVQFLIHTREEFEKAVKAEAKRLLEKALS